MLNLSSRKGIVPYLLALAAVLVMTGVRWLLVPTLGEQLPFTTLIIAVLLAAWYGGLGLAVFATAMSALLALFLFSPSDLLFAPWREHGWAENIAVQPDRCHRRFVG